MLLCCHLSDDPLLLARAEAVSLPERAARAAKKSFPQGKAASLAAGLLLRHGLFLQGIEGASLSNDANGRPFLVGDPIRFSLSHSGEYAICALSRHAVGADIQRVVAVSQRAVRRFCTEEEQAWLDYCAPEQRASEIIRLWALKESYLKATQMKTEQVFGTVLVTCNGHLLHPPGWRFSLDSSLAGYWIALCEASGSEAV